MTTLPPTTTSRLQKIPLANIVWEGDRRPLGSMAAHFEGARNRDDQCIIWLDGSDGAVRAMDMVAEDVGIEAVVRTLLRAIESPHHPNQPCRPQKIVVCDREIQFFLRGVLQELDIEVEYVPQLPLIERLFAGFAEIEAEPDAIPNLYQAAIERVTSQIWQIAPWELLTDSDILAIDLKNCEIERVYACVMGMMSAEYGILLYRSLDSLKQFRAAALSGQKSAAKLEQAFLAQDCWFLNYEEQESGNSEPEMDAFFGSLHPFEGMRHSLDEAETRIVYAVLESLQRFYTRQRSQLEKEPIAPLTKSYRVALPTIEATKKTISTQVSTLPELSLELLDMGAGDSSLIETAELPIQEDLIPDGSLISLGSIPQTLVGQLQQQPKTYCQSSPVDTQASELPTVFIQTTRPKANSLIDRIKEVGGLKAVCFNPGQDPFSGELYNLGMLQTADDELSIFAEYSQDVPAQKKALEKWHHRSQKNQGYCGVVVAMGATGANRGDPQQKDMLALFQVKSINGADIGMGVLQLMPDFDF